MKNLAMPGNATTPVELEVVPYPLSPQVEVASSSLPGAHCGGRFARVYV